MPEEEVKTTEPTPSDEDIVGKAILGASRGGNQPAEILEKPAEEVKPAETEEKSPVETKEQPPKETPPPTETEVQSGILDKKITDLIKDPQKLAKRWIDQESFIGRQTEEIGRLRQAERELLELKTQQQVTKKVETDLNPNLVELANTDPDRFNEVVVTKEKLGELVQSQVNQAIGEIKNAESLEQELTTVYPGYKDNKPAMRSLAQSIPNKTIPPEEILYWATEGYNWLKNKDKVMADATKLAREQIDNELADKEKANVDHGRVTSTETKPELTDSEIMTDTLLNLRR